MKSNLELISFIVALISFLGMVVIIWRKIPVLLTLPETEEKSPILDLKTKRKKPLFSYERFLEKILMKIRIGVLKIENLLFHKIQALRKKNKEKIGNDYWKKIKEELKK